MSRLALSALLAIFPLASLLNHQAQAPTNQTATLSQSGVSLQQMLSAKETFAQPMRLARTPKLDGNIRPEEWDLLIGAPTAIAAPAVPVAQPATPATDGTVTSDQGATATPAQVATATAVPVQTGIAQSAIAQSIPALTSGPTTYLNWEPGKIYLAATIPAGQDLLISVDGGSDGFLVGNDNLEIRVTPGTPAVVKARVLDASNPAGPTWIDASGYAAASTVVSSIGPNGTTIELALVDPGFGILKGQKNDSFGIRVDSIGTDVPPLEPFLPRVTTPVTLVDTIITGLPAGLTGRIQDGGRTIVPGDATSIRFSFKGKGTLGIKTLDIAAEMPYKDQVNALKVPFPAFDKKDSVNIDYPTRVSLGAIPGYGVLHGTLQGTGLENSLMQGSIKIAKPLEVYIPGKMAKNTPQGVKVSGSVQIQSWMNSKIEGFFTVLPPSGWTITGGSDKAFYIYDHRGRVFKGFGLQVPAGVKGSFPVTLRVTAMGGVIDTPFWVTVL